MRQMTYIRTVCLLGVAVVANTACGFVLTHGPPEGHEQMDYFSCTESNAGPIIDLVWASLNVTGAAVISANPEEYENADAAVAGGLIWGAVSTAAAIVGFNKTSKCREAKRLQAQRLGAGVRRTEESADSTVASVRLSPAQGTMVVNGQLQLLATTHNSSGVVVQGRVFSWSSSNDAIASVSAAGLVTAHATGSVVIAARSDGVVGTATIEVTPEP
jgi:uncharacterized protein YjdB